MNLANDTQVVESDCIPLELSFDGQTCSFALAPDETRAIAVGSLLGADLRIDRPGVAPVQFHIERENDQLWIVPAYDSGDLRVDAVRIRGPKRLDNRAVIEFCGLRVIAKVLHLSHAAEPISSARLRQRSLESAQQRVKAFEERPLGAMGSISMISPPCECELPTTAFQRFVIPAILAEEQATTRYPVFSKSLEREPQCAAAIEPLPDIGLGDVITPAPIRAVGEFHPTCQSVAVAGFRPHDEASSTLQTQETLRFIAIQWPQKPLSTRVSYEARAVIQVSSAETAKSRVMRLMTQLGIFTESRPALVLLGGAVTVFVLFAVIGWFTRH